MKVTKAEIAVLVFALLPFVVRFGDRSVETVNGIERVKWDYNYAGVVLGVVALVAIYIGLRDLKDEQPEQRDEGPEQDERPERYQRLDDFHRS